MKYFDPKPILGTYVSYRFVDKNGTILKDENYACFALILQAKIPDEVYKIVVYHPLTKVPYKPDIIKRWVSELNSLGFPMKFTVKNENIEFTILLHEYALKTHIACTLTLIRCAFELHICLVLEYYFEILEKKKLVDPNDRFAALQTAHKLACQKPIDLYNKPNTGHMLTYDENFTSPISYKTFTSRLKKTKQKTRDSGFSGIHALLED